MTTMQTTTAVAEAAMRPPPPASTAAAATEEDVFLTLTVAGQACAVPVLAVRDVLGAHAITRIPLAPGEVAGSLNLRGRIVTALDLRLRLGLPPREVAENLGVSVPTLYRWVPASSLDEASPPQGSA